MEISKRMFLKTCSLGAMATFCGGLRPVRSAVGLGTWAEALAVAREQVKCRLRVHEPELLAGWSNDARIPIVNTGCVENGKWRLKTRGLCMEFLLRMEIMGPIASTPHPQPGDPWTPVLQVGAMRRLMLRMLAESHVDVVFNVPEALPFLPSGRQIDARDIVAGQQNGILKALLERQRTMGEIFDGETIRQHMARELSLPG